MSKKVQSSKVKVQRKKTPCFRCSSGFTLIEVLVVATIIGLLATIGFAGFQAVTRGSRDALRKSDMEQIRSALEIYKSDTGAYPATDANYQPVMPTSYLVPPADPKPTLYKYVYQPGVSNLQYNLCAHLENGSLVTAYCSPPTNLCGPSGANCNYVVTNP